MKNNILKVLYILTEIVLFCIIVVFCIFNFDRTTEYFCAAIQQVYSTKLIYLTLSFSVIGFILGFLFNKLLTSKVSDMCNAYQKRHESVSIQNDSDKAKIATLEAKIATLEVALESALKNK